VRRADPNQAAQIVPERHNRFRSPAVVEEQGNQEKDEQ
jgi:hypothetical protein